MWGVYRALCENSQMAAGPLGAGSLKIVERSAIVKYTPSQMFALVSDVGRYPEFLPWCVDARAEEVSEGERLASVKVARGLLQAEFTTRNTLLAQSQILMQLVHGPFRELTGLWRFDGIGEHGCKVQFKVEFEFKNRLTATAFNAIFETLCATIVDAFAQRAQKIYG